MDSVQMATLTNLRYHFQNQHPHQPLSTLEHSIAGLGCGIAVSLVATPVEQIKNRLQIQYDQKTKVYNGTIDCAKQLVRNNGIVGLWQGLQPCMLFRSFFWVLWGSYDVYTKWLASYVPKESIPFFAGGLAANTFWCISFPAGKSLILFWLMYACHLSFLLFFRCCQAKDDDATRYLSKKVSDDDKLFQGYLPNRFVPFSHSLVMNVIHAHLMNLMNAQLD